MSNALRDNNRIPIATGLLNTDGTTPTMLKANPTSHIMDYSDGSTGSDLSGDNAVRDDNRVTTLIAVSSSDGTTPVPLYINSSGELLVNSNGA